MSPAVYTPERWEQIKEAVRADCIGEVEDEDAEPAEEFEVTEIDTDVDPAKLPASPKRTYKKAEALGWNITLQSSVTHHPPVVLLKDSAKARKDGTKGRKGDVRSPAKDVTHLFMSAVHESRKLGFLATWKSNSFSDATVRDPLGIPVELYGDYSKGPRPAECDVHNDGISYLAKMVTYSSAAPFEDWLADWMEMKGVEVKRPTPRKKKEEPMDVGIGLIETGEWSAAA